MNDARKVRPVAPLDAERAVTPNDGISYWWVPDPFMQNGKGWGFTDAEFAAHFMPAELFDAVLTAARALVMVGANDFPWALNQLEHAVRAYDAHRPTT